MKCLNKLLMLKSGQVLVNGRSIEKISRKEVAEVILFVPMQMEGLFIMPVFDMSLSLTLNNVHSYARGCTRKH